MASFVAFIPEPTDVIIRGAVVSGINYVATVSPLTLSLDTAPPVVANFVPPPGAISRYQALQFDVTDNREVTALVVSVRFEPVPPGTNRPKEVVFDAEGFADAYRAHSTVQTIPSGYRFSILRDGGWPSAPRIHVLASDGLVAT
jgi:hypothetical protein